MNQIAIGESAEYIVLEGQLVAAPFYHAAPIFANLGEESLNEKMEIILKGTPAQITTALADLEKIIYHAELYAHSAYPYPQYLRFQMAPGDPYFYSEISNLYLTCNPAGYKTHARGSLALELHYSRLNYFDGPQVEIPLSGRFGEDLTGGAPLYNHTDYHPTHGSTVIVKPGDLASPLPAPLRIELENTTAVDAVKDVYIGVYHHQTHQDETPFFITLLTSSGGHC